MIVATRTIQREMIHWLWLWTLAAIAVSVMQGAIRGQSEEAMQGPSRAPTTTQRIDETDPGTPIPMPNIDRPEWFRYPGQSPLPSVDPISLSEILQLHRVGDYEASLKQWKLIRPLTGSETWKQVGIGVALLRLDRHEQAIEHLEKALEQDPGNAVAEYFMGRVRQMQGRQVPFWYESDEQAPFRLASAVQPLGASSMKSEPPQDEPRSKMFLPHYIDDAYDRLARRHFRRAVTLAPGCDLESSIRVAKASPPTIQLASQSSDRFESVTVGDLLDSLGERDYVRKAKAELGVRGQDLRWEDSAAATAVFGGDLGSTRLICSS